MNTTIRAKFRCMSLKPDWQGYTEVLLRPVMGNKGNSEENKQFWEATPNGEASFTVKGHSGFFEPGVFYYIDMWPEEFKPDMGWQLYEVAKRAEGIGSVIFQPHYKERDNAEREIAPLWGSLKMDITKSSTLALFGEPGRWWRITFARAPSDE
jgi:hypothetical protein